MPPRRGRRRRHSAPREGAGRRPPGAGWAVRAGAGTRRARSIGDPSAGAGRRGRARTARGGLRARAPAARPGSRNRRRRTCFRCSFRRTGTRRRCRNPGRPRLRSRRWTSMPRRCRLARGGGSIRRAGWSCRNRPAREAPSGGCASAWRGPRAVCGACIPPRGRGWSPSGEAARRAAARHPASCEPPPSMERRQVRAACGSLVLMAFPTPATRSPLFATAPVRDRVFGSVHLFDSTPVLFAATVGTDQSL